MCTNCGTPVPELVAALREARAERDEARAAIARVRELADRWESSRPDEDTTVDEAHVWNAAGIRVRRILDGEA